MSEFKPYRYSVYGATVIGIDLENVKSLYPSADFNSTIDEGNAEQLKSLEQTKSLIAAASDMLRVLEGLYIETLGHGPNADEVNLRVLREVIKKAKGE